MNTRKHNPDKLEQLIDNSLRQLPVRQAPHSLQANVMAELQRRAVLPWWRKSFMQWPVTARVAFLALSLGAANVTINLLRWLSTWISAEPQGLELVEVINHPGGWITSLIGLARGTHEFFALLIRHVPTPWLYGGVMGLVLLYAALLGLGAAAYRTLYVSR